MPEQSARERRREEKQETEEGDETSLRNPSISISVATIGQAVIGEQFAHQRLSEHAHIHLHHNISEKQQAIVRPTAGTLIALPAADATSRSLEIVSSIGSGKKPCNFKRSRPVMKRLYI